MKRITLTEWAEVTLSRTPHINTLRSWAKNGNIPGAVKFGLTWFVPAGVEYQPVPVSKILGHTTTKTTERYAHMEIERQRTAMEKAFR